MKKENIWFRVGDLNRLGVNYQFCHIEGVELPVGIQLKILLGPLCHNKKETNDLGMGVSTV